MASNNPKNKKQASQVQVKVRTNTFVGSLYSQVVGISVTDKDITFEFVFINPRDGQGEVVSRVTMPTKSALDLSQAIINTIKLHEAKKKGYTND